MNTLELANQLLEDAVSYHNDLVEQARAVAKYRDLLRFIVECITFAEYNFPSQILQAWFEYDKTMQVLEDRSKSVFQRNYIDPLVLSKLNSTAGTAATGTFSLLTNNYNFLEDSNARTEYMRLAGIYKGLVNSEEDQNHVFYFLTPLNQEAASKYQQGISEFQSLPSGEDPQGPLMALRSAINLTLQSLIKITPLTRKEKSNLKRVSILPIIAQHLSKDEASKIDLILANDQLQDLWKKLSSAKDIKLERTVAETLVSQTTSILNLVAKTINY